MRGTDVLIFLIVMAVLVVLPSLFMRYKWQTLRHQERMAALEKGAQLPVEPIENPPWTSRIYLLRGLIWLFSGIAVVIFLGGLAMTDVEMDSLESRMWRAEQLRSAGMPEEQWKRVINEPAQQHQRIPNGLALIGLVPIGVGLAYLIFYAGERKQQTAP
jgi:Domain of unknown function (DUF6249)